LFQATQVLQHHVLGKSGFTLHLTFSDSAGEGAATRLAESASSAAKRVLVMAFDTRIGSSRKQSD
jgi:hypothetical protein